MKQLLKSLTFPNILGWFFGHNALLAEKDARIADRDQEIARLHEENSELRYALLWGHQPSPTQPGGLQSLKSTTTDPSAQSADEWREDEEMVEAAVYDLEVRRMLERDPSPRAKAILKEVAAVLSNNPT